MNLFYNKNINAIYNSKHAIYQFLMNLIMLIIYVFVCLHNNEIHVSLCTN